jgi:hypothetical protein
MTDDSSDAFAVDLHRRHVQAVSEIGIDATLQAATHAAIFLALESMSHAEVSAWLRRLADQIDAFDPAARGRAN